MYQSAGGRPRLSVIIPAFNEEATIAASVEELATHLHTLDPQAEIIVVDDGSSDDTAGQVIELTTRYPQLSCLRLPVSSGKGAAVRHGVLTARGQFIVFIDADLPFDLDVIEGILRQLIDGSDVVTGDRTLPLSRNLVHISPVRLLFGKTLAVLLNLVVFRGPLFPDTQCGVKGFRSPVALELFLGLETKGFGFDIEILVRAIDRGFRITRMPVVFRQNGPSHVRLLRDSVSIFRSILQLNRRRKDLKPPSTSQVVKSVSSPK